MKQTEHVSVAKYPGTIASYTLGFAASLVLTFAAYLTITQHWVHDTGLALGVIMTLAVIQLVIQLVFFLHLGRESKPRWNLTAFVFMVILVSIIVVGSLWIMNNLNYNMQMTPEQMNEYMLKESKKGF